MSDMTYSWAAVQGLVEGLTEFIPVSSTGHLILVGQAFGVNGDAADTFEIFIQLGAILAVVWLYWKRFAGLLDFSRAENPDSSFRGVQGMIRLFIACVPAFIVGGLFSSAIKARLFSAIPVASAMVAGGLLMWWVESRKHQVRVNRIEEISLLQCFGIGVFQCLALWPGMSRSASTIIGGMLLGLERKVAAEFSFLVAVPVILAATAYDMLKSFSKLPVEAWPFFVVGLVVSFLTAIPAVKFFISILGRYTLKPFAAYRIVAGIAVLYVML